jgi:hypothetical protein
MWDSGDSGIRYDDGQGQQSMPYKHKLGERVPKMPSLNWNRRQPRISSQAIDDRDGSR